MVQHQFSGIWRSRYWYPSNNHEGEDVSECRVEVHRRGNRLTLQSLPESTEYVNYSITINLVVDGKLATGNWTEHTSSQGQFEGMIYSGALQLLISDDDSRMEGKWVGVGREKLANGSYEPQIYNGRWLLEKLEDAAV